MASTQLATRLHSGRDYFSLRRSQRIAINSMYLVFGVYLPWHYWGFWDWLKALYWVPVWIAVQNIERSRKRFYLGK